MISKKKVESAIAQVDMLVKEACEAVGFFDYDSKDLQGYWGDARRKLAYVAAKIISGNAAKSKEKKNIIRSFDEGNMVTEDVAKDKNVIALDKSKKKKEGLVTKLYIKVKKMMED